MSMRIFEEKGFARLGTYTKYSIREIAETFSDLDARKQYLFEELNKEELFRRSAEQLVSKLKIVPIKVSKLAFETTERKYTKVDELREEIKATEDRILFDAQIIEPLNEICDTGEKLRFLIKEKSFFPYMKLKFYYQQDIEYEVYKLIENIKVVSKNRDKKEAENSKKNDAATIVMMLHELEILQHLHDKGYDSTFKRASFISEITGIGVETIYKKLNSIGRPTKTHNARMNMNEAIQIMEKAKKAKRK